MNKFYPAREGEKLFNEIKSKNTQEEMDKVWFDFKNSGIDPVYIWAVEQYFLEYKSYYFYIALDGIVGCIKERIKGEF